MTAIFENFYYIRVWFASLLIGWAKRIASDVFAYDDDFIDRSLRKRYTMSDPSQLIKNLQTINAILASDPTCETDVLLGLYLIGAPLIEKEDILLTDPLSWGDKIVADDLTLEHHRYVPNLIRVHRESDDETVIYHTEGYQFVDVNGRIVDTSFAEIVTCKVIETVEDLFPLTEQITAEVRNEANWQLGDLPLFITQDGKKRKVYQSYARMREFFPID